MLRETPPHPTGRSDVAGERPDVRAPAARRAVDDLAVAEPERVMAVTPGPVPEEENVARSIAAGGRVRTDTTRDDRCGDRGLGVGQKPVRRPLRHGREAPSIPACAIDQRTNIEQSHAELAGSRVCMSCTVPPRFVGGPRLYVKRPTCATAHLSTLRAPPQCLAPHPEGEPVPVSRTFTRLRRPR